MKSSAGKDAWRKSAILLRAVAHPLRRSIIDALANGEQAVGQIVSITGLPQALTSQQLKILRDQALLTSRWDGGRKYYQICEPSVLKVLRDLRRRSLIS